jgi:hypothetical protein
MTIMYSGALIAVKVGDGWQREYMAVITELLTAGTGMSYALSVKTAQTISLGFPIAIVHSGSRRLLLVYTRVVRARLSVTSAKSSR